MRLDLTKHPHACVALASAGTTALFDPGTLGAPAPLDGVDAVFVTHDHADHADPELLREACARGIPVWMPSDARDRLDLPGDRVETARPGDVVRVDDLVVEVLGHRHAEVHPEIPVPSNHAYLVDGRVLVTGDEHPDLAPGTAVDVLVTPVDAPWLRATDLIRFVRRVQPRRVVGVHDGLLNAAGLTVARSVLASLQREGVQDVDLFEVGTSIAL